MTKNEVAAQSPLLFSTRFLILVLAFCGTGVLFTHKTDISVGIVCMVNHTALHSNTSKLSSSYDYESSLQYVDSIDKNPICRYTNQTSKKDRDGPFVWSKTVQEVILSVYFVGYTMSQLLGGWLSVRFGPKKIFFSSIFFGSIGTLLVPLCSKWDLIALCVIRLLTGLVQGTLYPSMTSLWANWAPINERGRLLGISSAGCYFGTVVSFSLGGYLCEHGFDDGWPSIFYIFGIVGIVWSILWFFLAADSPENHSFISDDEKTFIINECREVKLESLLLSKRKTPWKAILTSKQCISLSICHSCMAFHSILFLTNIPTYMKEVLKFDIQSNGLLSSVPYICAFVSMILSSISSDALIKSGIMSRCNVRRLYNGVGYFGLAACTIAIGFVKCDRPYFAVIIIGLSTLLGGCASGGILVSFNDVGESYTGIVFGISNTFASLNGIIVPYIVAFVTKNQTQEEWMIVFMVTATLCIVGGIISVFFIKSKPEAWSNQTEIGIQ